MASNTASVLRPSDHGMVHARVLTQIERREVKAKGIDAREQSTHQEIAGMHATMRAQAFGNQAHVAAELRRSVIAIRTAVQRIAQALGNLPEQHAIWHAIVPRGRESRCSRQQRPVFLNAPGHSRRHAYAHRTLRKLLRQRLALIEIVIDDDLLLARQRLADTLGVHIRGAVHIPAHPGSEAHQ